MSEDFFYGRQKGGRSLGRRMGRQGADQDCRHWCLHPGLNVFSFILGAFSSGAAGFSKRTMDSGTRPVGSYSSPAGLSREYKLVMLGAGGVGKSGR